MISLTVMIVLASAVLVNTDVAHQLPIKQLTGITISCQGSGRIWATDAFASELDTLAGAGANAVSIHPYGRIHGDGRVTYRWISGEVPDYVTRPVQEAKDRGLAMMMKPHLAYWGSPFSWRGAIKFEDPADRARFFETYEQWIVSLAQETRNADIFVVGTELEGLTSFEKEWRHLIAEVRKVTAAKLTYAANWDNYQKVPFWDALDFVGIQAYFPLASETNPTDKTLRASWSKIMQVLDDFGEVKGKQILFTELGYNRSTRAAKEPWDYHQESNPEATDLQRRCLTIALEAAEKHSSRIAGVFLWKWFVGPAPHENFYLNENHMIEVITTAWRRQGSGTSNHPGVDLGGNKTEKHNNRQ